MTSCLTAGRTSPGGFLVPNKSAKLEKKTIKLRSCSADSGNRGLQQRRRNPDVTSRRTEALTCSGHQVESDDLTWTVSRKITFLIGDHRARVPAQRRRGSLDCLSLLLFFFVFFLRVGKKMSVFM